jgi:hypothetical protein
MEHAREKVRTQESYLRVRSVSARGTAVSPCTTENNLASLREPAIGVQKKLLQYYFDIEWIGLRSWFGRKHIGRPKIRPPV